MSIYPDLIKLRPGMPAQSLFDIIGKEWTLGEDGGITINGCFSVRVDVDGIIGQVSIDDGFPRTLSVDGLRPAMPFGDIPTGYACVYLEQNMFKTLDVYRACHVDAFETLVHVTTGAGVDKANLVHHIEFVRRDAVFRGDEWRGRTMAIVKNRRAVSNDQRLLDWAMESASDDDNSSELYARWLLKASPEDRHLAAQNWNWDRGYEPMEWIIRQPDCELATASEMFWMLDPFYLATALRGEKPDAIVADTVALLGELRDRAIAGQYVRATIGTRERSDGDLPADLANAVPDAFVRAVSGITLDTSGQSFTDGIPDAAFDR